MSAAKTIEIIPHKRISENNISILSTASFEKHIKKFSHLPWLKEIKEAAWEKFLSLPMPTRTQEAWRFSKFGQLELDNYHLCIAPNEYEQVEIEDRSNIVQEYAGRLVFEDNHLLDHNYVLETYEEQGVIFCPLIEAFENHPELIKTYFAQQITHLGSEKFQYLNIAYAHAGSFLYVPEGVKIKEPLIAYHWANAPSAALFPNTLIIAEKQAEVNFIDVFTSHDLDSAGLAASVSHTYAASNAKVFRKIVQNWNDSMLSFQIDRTIAQENAEVKSVALNLGAQKARYENELYVEGKKVDAKMYSLTIANGQRAFDQRTHQVHNAGESTSDLLYKNALLDKAQTIFSGLIYVEEQAQKTDAYQTNRNLILSGEAEANALPGLEIKANDVKCSHGATTGDLDRSNLFYMLSRGIPKHKAEELLVFGFFEEILQKIDNEELAKTIRYLIEKKFESHHENK